MNLAAAQRIARSGKVERRKPITAYRREPTRRADRRNPWRRTRARALAARVWATSLVC